MDDALKTESEQLSHLMVIQDQIGVWSYENFGDQPYTNPLLGIAEEAGEFFESGKIEDMIDAGADSMIFCMDFLNRYTVPMVSSDNNHWYLGMILIKFKSNKDSWERFKEVGIFNAIPIYTGKIVRSVLKLNQGIRKDEDHVKALAEAIASLYFAYDRVLNYSSDEHDGPSNMYEAISTTWNNIVTKRDWTPETKMDGGSNHGEDRKMDR